MSIHPKDIKSHLQSYGTDTFNKQIEDFRKAPQDFELLTEKTKTFILNHREHIPPTLTTLCKNHAERPCLFGTNCDFAHSIAVQRAAMRVLKNPQYKRTVCENGKRCEFGTRCIYIHKGDVEYPKVPGQRGPKNRPRVAPAGTTIATPAPIPTSQRFAALSSDDSSSSSDSDSSDHKSYAEETTLSTPKKAASPHPYQAGSEAASVITQAPHIISTPQQLFFNPAEFADEEPLEAIPTTDDPATDELPEQEPQFEISQPKSLSPVISGISANTIKDPKVSTLLSFLNDTPTASNAPTPRAPSLASTPKLFDLSSDDDSKMSELKLPPAAISGGAVYQSNLNDLRILDISIGFRPELRAAQEDPASFAQRMNRIERAVNLCREEIPKNWKATLCDSFISDTPCENGKNCDAAHSLAFFYARGKQVFGPTFKTADCPTKGIGRQIATCPDVHRPEEFVRKEAFLNARAES